MSFSEVDGGIQSAQECYTSGYPRTSRVPDRGGALQVGYDSLERTHPMVMPGNFVLGTVFGRGGEVASEYLLAPPPWTTWCRPWRQKAGASPGNQEWQSTRRSRPHAPSCRPIVRGRVAPHGCHRASIPNRRYVGGGRSPSSSTAHARPQRPDHAAVQRSGRFPATLAPRTTPRCRPPTCVTTVLSVAEHAVSPQLTETDRDTCPAEGTRPHPLALLSPGDTVTSETTRRRKEGVRR